MSSAPDPSALPPQTLLTTPTDAADTPAPDLPHGPEHLPAHAGPYALEEELGRGGMGVVYEARQLDLNRVVALKMILAGSHAGTDDLARFRLEAEALAQLRHPNIVRIFEVGQHDGLPFLELEYIDGGSLAERLQKRKLPVEAAAELVETLARAVHAAHERGLVHRDLKPANVLLDRQGVPKLTDFGLAKRLDAPGGRTASGAILGTPNYMAPEQAEGKTRLIGPAADVYGLGAILYELLTGQTPFKADTSLDAFLQAMEKEPPRPAALNPRVPRDLETVCLKCLARDPRQRYASAGQLAEDLGCVLADVPLRHGRRAGRLARAFGRMGRSVRRRPLRSAYIALSLAAMVVLVLAIWLIGAGGVSTAATMNTPRMA